MNLKRKFIHAEGAAAATWREGPERQRAQERRANQTGAAAAWEIIIPLINKSLFRRGQPTLLFLGPYESMALSISWRKNYWRDQSCSGYRKDSNGANYLDLQKY
uniref:SPPL2A protein n=1 Tax=Fopius arisanus TaxID=64838 RepID=A0A0C9QJF4_9HYME